MLNFVPRTRGTTILITCWTTRRSTQRRAVFSSEALFSELTANIWRGTFSRVMFGHVRDFLYARKTTLLFALSVTVVTSGLRHVSSSGIRWRRGNCEFSKLKSNKNWWRRKKTDKGNVICFSAVSYTCYRVHTLTVYKWEWKMIRLICERSSVCRNKGWGRRKQEENILIGPAAMYRFHDAIVVILSGLIFGL